MHCSVLAEEALKSAIDNYLKKTEGEATKEVLNGVCPGIKV